MKRMAIVLLVLSFTLATIIGCGGGGSSSGSASGGEGGTLEVRVSYPQDNVEGRQVPSPTPSPSPSVAYYLIDIYAGGSPPGPDDKPLVPTTRIDFPETGAVIAGIPVGTVGVEIKGYDSNNQLIFYGFAVVVVSANSQNSAEITVTPVTPTPTPTGTISPTPSPTTTASPSPTPTTSPSPSPTVSPSPSPTPEKGTILISTPLNPESSSRSPGSQYPTVSDDGEVVAFQSTQLLVSDHSNSNSQIYMWSQEKGSLKLISRSPNGAIGSNSFDPQMGDSLRPYVSGNGEFIAFQSGADNLLGQGADFNGFTDVFVYDDVSGATGRISTDRTNSYIGGDQSSIRPAISADGKYAAYQSDAQNLSNASTQAQQPKVYRSEIDSGRNGRTPQTLRTILISNKIGENADPTVGSTGLGSYNPCISRDGRFVAYESEGKDIVSSPDVGESPPIQIYLCDTENDLATRSTLLSQVNGKVADSSAYSPHISDNGNRVVFHSNASSLPGNPSVTDVYLWDRNKVGIELVSKASGGVIGNSENAIISADGRYVTFSSYTNSFVQNDNNGAADCFVKDLTTGEYTMVSVSTEGAQGSSGSYYPFISGDSNYVAFHTLSKNIASFPTPPSSSIFDVFLNKWK